MTKFTIEIINKSGQIKKRTFKVPRDVNDVREYLRHKIFMSIESNPKYRHTSSAFWREWELYEYYKS